MSHTDKQSLVSIHVVYNLSDVMFRKIRGKIYFYIKGRKDDTSGRSLTRVDTKK